MPKEIITIQQDIILTYDDEAGKQLALKNVKRDINWIAISADKIHNGIGSFEMIKVKSSVTIVAQQPISPLSPTSS